MRMPKIKLPYVEYGLYHVRARSNNREWFYIPISDLWKIFLKQFQEVSVRYNAHIVAFVLMSNHYHLLIETPLGNLGLIMNYLQREVSRSVGAISGRTNHVFGGTYKGTLIANSRYLHNVYRYVYQNPLRAGLCNKVESYPFSTIRFLAEGIFPIPLSDYVVCERGAIPRELSKRLEWLNQPLAPEQTDLIQRGLKKAQFQFPKKYALRNLVLSLDFDAGGFPGK